MRGGVCVGGRVRGGGRGPQNGRSYVPRGRAKNCGRGGGSLDDTTQALIDAGTGAFMCNSHSHIQDKPQLGASSRTMQQQHTPSYLPSSIQAPS